MWAFQLLARWNAFRLAGRWFASRIRLVRPATPGQHRYNILVMEKGGLGLDILSSLPAEEGYAIYFGNRTDLQSIARAFLPDVGDYSYRYANEEAKLHYRAFLGRLLPYVKRRIRIDVVVSANIVYFAERELSALLKEHGIPHIVLHKECLKTPDMVCAYRHYYREGVGAIKAARVITYNDIENASQLSAEIVTVDQIVASGMPRLDRFHHWRQKASKVLEPRIDVLFLFFNTNVGIQDPIGEYLTTELRRGWVDLSRQTYEAILRLAIDNPDIRITVKAKGFAGGVRGLSQHAFGGDNLPRNLMIRLGGDPFNFITDAKVVCGFNTTGLLETIASGIPVVIPHYAEATSTALNGSLVNLNEAAIYAESPDQLIAVLAKLARQERKISDDLGQGQLRALKHWVGNADGKAGERVSQQVLNAIRSASIW